MTAALLAAPFCFLRHGETESNRLGLIAGASDVPLNATGLAQARSAAQRLAGSNVDAIWSSPLQRAYDTARCVADVLGLDIVIVPELAERNWGEREGQPRAMRGPRPATPPGGEGLEAFRARTLAGFARITPSRLPLVVAHSGTFRILGEWLGLPAQDAPVANSVPLRLYRDPLRGVWTSAPL